MGRLKMEHVNDELDEADIGSASEWDSEPDQREDRTRRGSLEALEELVRRHRAFFPAGMFEGDDDALPF